MPTCGCTDLCFSCKVNVNFSVHVSSTLFIHYFLPNYLTYILRTLVVEQVIILFLYFKVRLLRIFFYFLVSQSVIWIYYPAFAWMQSYYHLVKNSTGTCAKSNLAEVLLFHVMKTLIWRTPLKGLSLLLLVLSSAWRNFFYLEMIHRISSFP